MPATLIPNSINQTARPPVQRFFCLTSPQKPAFTSPPSTIRGQKRLCQTAPVSQEQQEESRFIFYLLLTVTAAASLEPAARIIEA